MNSDDDCANARDVPELIPIRDYDVKTAKLRASVSWLLAKAYGEDQTGDIAQPFYDEPQGSNYLKPTVVNGLVSAEIYCRACSKLFTNTASTWKGHESVIQALSRRGVYVMDPRESAVTENMLTQASPLKLDAHLALIDSLMLAHLSEVVTVERAVKAVRCFAVLNASNELPYNSEDALLLWINKTCSSVRHYLDAQQAHLAQRRAFGVPVIDDLVKDLCDGCSLAATISFYCPQALQLHYLALHETVGVADSLYNLQLIGQFCSDHAPLINHLTISDLFHSAPLLKPNLLVFLADLFKLLVIDKPDFVRDTSKPFASSLVYTGPTGGLVETAETSSKKTPGSVFIPDISSVTKRSFQKTPVPDQTSVPQNPALRQPLLPRRLAPENTRQSGARSRSLASAEERADIADVAQEFHDTERSQQALNLAHRALEVEKRDFGFVRTGSLRGSGKSDFTNVCHNSMPPPNNPMLSNVSIDSELSMDLTDTSLDLSNLTDSPPHNSSAAESGSAADLGSKENIESEGQPANKSLSYTISTNLPQPGHPDYLELQSLTSRTKASSETGFVQNGPEPLLPAQIRPAKEKTSTQPDKQVESGEKLGKKSPSSPTKLVMPKRPGLLLLGAGEGDDVRDSSGASTPSEEYQTPSMENAPFPGFSEGEPSQIEKPVKTRRSSSREGSAEGSVRRSSLDRHRPVAQSFTLHNQPKTPEGARAAGIPVLSNDGILQRIHGKQMEMSTSSDGSDQELSKIYADTRVKEKRPSLQNGQNGSPEASQRPDSLHLNKTNRTQKSSKENASPVTSFAQIKRQKENGHSTSRSEVDGDPPLSREQLVSAKSETKKQAKKTSFAELPNQTTWQKKAESNNSKPADVAETDALEPLTSELVDIRMRLAERRRQMDNEKRQKEMQLKSQRQKLGKQAFIQVVSKKDAASKAKEAMEELPRHVKPDERSSRSKSCSPRTISPISKVPDEYVTPSHGDKLQERLSRESASPSNVHEGSPKAKDYSRERIQNMIDSGRRKWFPNEQTTEGEPHGGEQSDRPVVLAHEDTGEESGSQMTKSMEEPIQDRPRSSLGVDNNRRLSEEDQTARMSSSVDALREQLNEAKQSQSNQGKSTYNASLDKLNSSLSELQGEIMRLSLQQDQKQTQSDRKTPSGVGEPDVGGASQTLPHQNNMQPYNQVPPHPIQPPPPPHVQYPGPTYPSYQYQPYGQYPPQYPYPPPPPQYQQPYPVMHPPQWQTMPYTTTQMPPQPTFQPSTAPISTHAPVSTQPPIPTHAHISTSSPGEPREGEPSYVMVSSDTQTTPGSPQLHHSSSLHSVSNLQHSPVLTPSQTMTRSLPPESHRENLETTNANDGFFVSFGEDSSPRKPKPKLGHRGKAAEEKNKSHNKEHAHKKEPSPPQPTVKDDLAQAQLLEAVQARLNVSPGVGFMVEDDSSNGKKEDMSDLDKKKQRILQQQAKRREENEKKRQKQERDNAAKRQEQLLKQEQAEQKKAEEKLRRDAIYQQYLERKERESSEEAASTQSSPGGSAVARRLKNKHRTRPKSQPPGSMPSDPAHRNAMDLVTGCPDVTSGMNRFAETDLADSNLAYGGLTHRRPPTPDRVSRTSNMDENGTYMGPKLFVKPSQKSNRTIIMNAISHCCLAGTVNTEVKKKTLEVMSQVDANHFVLLFRDASMQYRGLYTYNIEREEIIKIHGVGPKQLTHKMFDGFYKYNSGAKNFSKISSTKHLSATIDAVTIQATIWQKKQQIAPPKKPPQLY